MSCCEYKCTQTRDCPIRKQRIEDVNQAFIERAEKAEKAAAQAVGGTA